MLYKEPILCVTGEHAGKASQMVNHYNPLHQNTAQSTTKSATLPESSGKSADVTVSELTMPNTGVLQPEGTAHTLVKQHNPLHDVTMSTGQADNTVPLDTLTASPPAASQLPAHSATHDMSAADLELTMPSTGTTATMMSAF